MRTVTLPDSGRQVTLGVFHEDAQVDLAIQGPVVCRTTRVRLTMNPGPEVEVRSVCSPNDNFCRREGRRVAASKLLRGLRMSKADKRAIFQLICPEYKQKDLTV